MSLPTFEELGISKQQLARGFAERWAGKLRYVVEWKCWMFLKGDTWVYDEGWFLPRNVGHFMEEKHTPDERPAVTHQLGNQPSMAAVQMAVRLEPLLRVSCLVFGPEDKVVPPIRVQMAIERMENRIRRVIRTAGSEGISEEELKRRCGVKG